MFEDGELDSNSVVAKFATTASDGKKYNTNIYHLDAIISVGYRVNSKQATHFRRWSTRILKEYMIKGFVLDEELLKNNGRFGVSYFPDLLEKIREIRSSERLFNQKLTDIYATSYDYNPEAQLTRDFFATVQNTLIFAVSRQTAAEIIMSRSDKNKPHMGLTTWKDSPNGKILQSDVVISKNYLNHDELSLLNTLVDGFLTLAETRAMSNQPTFMKEWKALLDDYISLISLPQLENKGKISSDDARIHAINEYKEFRIVQDRDYQSDFDKMIIEVRKLEYN
ncbi:RhuM family protein [Methanobrevibacter sp.]|uniref:RhuM family protein n=1 Tax=Methanobrevibacter sp. TaxID=66852 RepID=UPI003868C405